jgi:outer membrane lipoprotein-sorting protein
MASFKEKIMFRKIALSLAALAMVAAPTMAQTVDEIVAKHIKALGGAEKLKSIQSKKFSGKFSGGGGPEIPFTVEQKRPDKVRLEFTFQGLKGVQAYDGKTGWSINEFGGKKDAELMGEEGMKAIQEQSDFDNDFLVDYAAKGHKVTLAGKEPIEGTDAYKLVINLKNGTTQTVYLDADEYLEIKSETKRVVRGTESEQETVSGDYKDVEGVMVPFSSEGGPKGSPSSAKQKVTVEKVEFNVPIDDSRFTMPAAGAAPANPAAAKPEAKQEKKEPKKPEDKPKN